MVPWEPRTWLCFQQGLIPGLAHSHATSRAIGTAGASSSLLELEGD